MEGSKQRLEDLKKALHTKIDTIKAYPSEVRSSGIWQASSELILKQSGIGLVAGLAVGVVLFSRPSLRGLAVGFGGGFGAGMGFEHCNNEFRILQGRSRPSVTPTKSADGSDSE